MNHAKLLDQALDLRLNLYFALTLKQQRKFYSMGGSHVLLESFGFDAWCQVTKSQQLRDGYKTLLALRESILSDSSPSRVANLGANVIDAREAFKAQSERMTRDVRECRVIEVDFKRKYVKSVEVISNH